MDLEFTAARRAVSRETTGIHSILRAVLAVAFPCDDEVAGRIDRDIRVALVLSCVRIDAKFGPQRRAGSIVATAKNAHAASVQKRALIDHDEVAVSISGGGRLVLRIERRGI